MWGGEDGGVGYQGSMGGIYIFVIGLFELVVRLNEINEVLIGLG